MHAPAVRKKRLPDRIRGSRGRHWDSTEQSTTWVVLSGALHEDVAVEFDVRAACAVETAQIRDVVGRAYMPYLDRMDRAPAPMLVDYTASIEAGAVWVIGQPIAAVIVLVPAGNALLVENVAVDPVRQGMGLGRTLLAFADRQAIDRGFTAIELYTNEAMTENLALYRRLGYEEVDRRTDDGYRRVYMRKRLA